MVPVFILGVKITLLILNNSKCLVLNLLIFTVYNFVGSGFDTNAELVFSIINVVENSLG